MGMEKQEILDRIHSLYPEAQIEIAGEDCSFEVLVIDDVFNGVMTLRRQQPILALFREELANGKLHALSVKARSVEEQAKLGGLVSL